MANEKTFVMDVIFGVIDALTSIFAQTCSSGIITAVGSVGQLVDSFGLDPRKLMKVSIAIANLLEGWNVIYANCDFTNQLV